MLMRGGARYPGLSDLAKLNVFESALIKLQLQVEESFLSIAHSTSSGSSSSLVVVDRGLLDVSAYLPRPAWLSLLASLSLSESALAARYDAVLHLTTAAIGAESFYKRGEVTDDERATVIREESPEEARQLDGKIMDAWKMHPRRGVITNEKDGFQGKLNRATDFVMKLVRELD